MTAEPTTTDRQLADRLAILEQVGRYSHAWDGKNAEAYAALYTEDAIFEVNPERAEGPSIHIEGREAIRAWASETHERQRGDGASVRHIQTGTLFSELTEGRALTRTMLITTRIEGDERRPRPNTSGIYTDEWRRTPEGWRLARRTLRHDGLVE